MLSDSSWPKGKDRCGLSVWRLNRLLSLVQKHIQSLTENERELPIVWSVMHMYGSVQLAKLLALKRGIDPELAAMACAFHDIYSLVTGKTANHGVLAEPIINDIVNEYNTTTRGILPIITEEEKRKLIEAIKVHSDKNTRSDDCLAEFLKDIDSLDSYLQGITQDKRTGRIPRVNKIFEELGIVHIIDH